MTDWEEIVAKHSGGVWRIAYRILGNHADAADCYQNVFIAALDVSRREPVRSWAGLLRRLATCKALGLLRVRLRRAGNPGNPTDWSAVASANPGPPEHAVAAELSERLRVALAELPEAQAEVFCLRYLGEMKYRHIARQLGLKTSAVGVLLHRARSRLRRVLSPEDVAETGVKDVEVSA